MHRARPACRCPRAASARGDATHEMTMMEQRMPIGSLPEGQVQPHFIRFRFIGGPVVFVAGNLARHLHRRSAWQPNVKKESRSRRRTSVLPELVRGIASSIASAPGFTSVRYQW